MNQCICPTQPILPSGVLMPNNANLSSKMKQSMQIKNASKYGGMTFYNNSKIVNEIYIGKALNIHFYYQSTMLTFQEIIDKWVPFSDKYEDALNVAAVYITLLNVRKIPNNLMFPFYVKDDLVYALTIQNGNILMYRLNPFEKHYYAYKKDKN